MELAEIEGLVAELESRLDRLRSLYDQYFMGIEKLEPGVPRKDVDRRIHILRKIQIRNTGIRFRFQMILQRYNTYQTYWQRICRQIEDGTYKRHMLRAEARFGGDGAPASRRKTRTSAPPPPSDALAAAASTPPSGDDNSWLELDFPEPSLPRITPIPSEPGAALARASAPPPSAPTVASKWRKAVPAAPRAESSPPPTPVAPAPIVGQQPAPRVAPPAPKHAPPPLPAAANSVKPPVARPPTAQPPAHSAPPPLPPRAQPTTAPKPPAPPPAKPAVPVAPAPRPAPASPSDLPDDRVRQIYSQYVETRRKQNESTASLTYDALAKSLRESSAKLREKHGRAVDFEVAVKDGRTILKPVVK